MERVQELKLKIKEINNLVDGINELLFNNDIAEDTSVKINESVDRLKIIAITNTIALSVVK